MEEKFINPSPKMFTIYSPQNVCWMKKRTKRAKAKQKRQTEPPLMCSLLYHDIFFSIS